jgi:hypothetical protein
VAREDKFRSAALTCSLPVTRSAVVASRYVGGWLLSLGTAAVLLGLCYAMARSGLAHAVGEWSAAPLAAFVAMGLILAGLIPFTIRFGFAGLMGFLVGTQVLGIVAFLAAVFVGGHGTLRLVIGAILQGVQGLREPLSSGGYTASLVAGVVALNVASYFLSRGIYRRREL